MQCIYSAPFYHVSYLCIYIHTHITYTEIHTYHITNICHMYTPIINTCVCHTHIYHVYVYNVYIHIQSTYILYIVHTHTHLKSSLCKCFCWYRTGCALPPRGCLQHFNITILPRGIQSHHQMRPGQGFMVTIPIALSYSFSVISHSMNAWCKERQRK